jgi:hypothetical protein
MLAQVMGTVLTIILGGALSGVCFVAALNKHVRRFVLSNTIWRYENIEQKRFLEILAAIMLIFGGVAIIAFLAFGLLKQ